MTARTRSISALSLAVAATVTGCGHSTKPTPQQRDLGPVNTKILGGTADSRYVHVFSASITVGGPGPRFAATLLYVGTGTDRLVGVTSPLGSATLSQVLSDDSAVPISVPLTGGLSTATPGSTVSAEVRLADHGPIRVTVPLVPAPSPSASAVGS